MVVLGKHEQTAAKLWRGGCLIVAVAGLLHTLSFTFSTGNAPWFDPLLKLDGGSYWRGMRALAQANSLLDLQDLYHSPGYQIYLTLVARLLPPDVRIFASLKLLNWLFFVALVGLVAVLGERHFGRGMGWLAAVLLAWSLKLHVYVNLLQGEVLQAFLCGLLLVTALAWHPSLGWRRSFALLGLQSLLCASLSLLQVRFLPILPLLAGAQLLRVQQAQPARFYFHAAGVLLGLLGPASAGLLAWSIYQSRRLDHRILLSVGSDFRLRAAYNPNAVGQSFPYPRIVEPTGWSFVRAYPGQTLWLIGRRLQYLFDLRRDMHNLGNPLGFYLSQGIVRTRFDLAWQLTWLVLLLGGLFSKLLAVIRLRQLPEQAVYLALLLGLLVGPLLVFASSRFLVPALPLIVLYQAFALARVGRGLLVAALTARARVTAES